MHEFHSKARYYFPFCPICGTIELEIIVIIGGKDNIFCNRCGAAWHIYFSLIKEKMKWAELISPSKNGKGKEYIGKKIKPPKWKEMAIKSHKVFKKNTEEK